MTEYQKSLQEWVSNLSDEQLNNYMNDLSKFNDAEFDALFFEEIKRIGKSA